MRYIVLATVAIGILILTARFSSLSNTAQIVLGLGAGGFFAYYLWNGFRSGTMEAPGVGYMAGHRVESPFRFWFCTIFNGGMMVGALVAALGLAGLFGN